MQEGSQSFALPGSQYGYTGMDVNNMTSSYTNTMVTTLVDESGSTSPFSGLIEKCIQGAVAALRMSPAVDMLIYRHVHFGTTLREIHGFKPLQECNEADYVGVWKNGGQTALYNSCCNVIDATRDYAKKQSEQKYLVNGIIFVITDGQDYLSVGKDKTAKDVADSLKACVTDESLESLLTIMIGVNEDPTVQKALKEFSDKAGFTQYIEIKNANEKSLAKLMKFISESVKAQSQSLGSGGPSSSLTF